MVLVLTRGLPSSTCGHEFYFPQLMDDPKVFPQKFHWPQLRLTLRAILDCLQAPQIAKDILSRQVVQPGLTSTLKSHRNSHTNWGKMSILMA